MTEPDAGTDTGRITTRAEPDGNGGWRVTGRKIWTSKALESEVVLLIARTRRRQRAARVSASSSPTSIATTSTSGHPEGRSQRGRVVRGRLRRPAGPASGVCVGNEGEGFQQLLHGLNPERVLLASEAFGIGEVALDRAVTYAKERIVFDQPIGANQAISHPLALARMRLKAAWMMALRRRTPLRRRPRMRRAGQHRQVPRRRSVVLRRRPRHADPRRHGLRHRVPRRALLARSPPQSIAPVTQEMTLNYIAQNIMGLPRGY